MDRRAGEEFWSVMAYLARRHLDKAPNAPRCSKAKHEGAVGTVTANPTIVVRNLWKIFGPAEKRLATSPDADLPNAELRSRFGSTAAIRDVSFSVPT
ncbi:MAG: hypothetical protein ABI131_09980, partial [Nostocoides sp.]